MGGVEILVLIFVCIVLGFYAREISDKGWEALKKANSRTEVIEVHSGSYHFTMQAKLVGNRFYYTDVTRPEEELWERFENAKQFTTVMKGVIGRDLGTGGHLTANWIKKGILRCDKICFNLFGQARFEYQPRLAPSGEMFGFHSRHYREAVKRGEVFGFLYIRNFIEHSDMKTFTELNKMNNNLDFRSFFRYGKFEEVMETSFNPTAIHNQRSALQRYSDIDEAGKLTGLIEYWLEHPELGLRRIK